VATKKISESIINIEKVKADLRKKEPPLVDVKVTNPLVYIKSWWNKIIGNEGIDFRLKIRPLTAIAISIIVLTVGMGIGRFVLPFKIPFFVYTSKITPTPESKLDVRETAFTGTLKHNFFTKRYYLLTDSSEAITLTVPENVKLNDFIGRRIFATGIYTDEKRILNVSSAEDLEILPNDIVNIPTTSLTNTQEISADNSPTVIQTQP